MATIVNHYPAIILNTNTPDGYTYLYTQAKKNGLAGSGNPYVFTSSIKDNVYYKFEIPITSSTETAKGTLSCISLYTVPTIEIPSGTTTITQEQANIIQNNDDVTILHGTTQKILYRKFTENKLPNTHEVYFV